MVPEVVPFSGGIQHDATHWKRNPLFITSPAKTGDKFPIVLYRPRDGRSPVYDQWDFNVFQLMEAMGEPNFMEMAVPQINTPLHATKLAEAEVQRQALHLEWYQAFNTALHYHVVASLDLSGESELRDQRALQAHVSRGKAKGVDTVLWARKFASVAGIDKQAVLLDRFRSIKLNPNATCVDLHRHVDRLFEIWRLLDGSDRDKPLSFYRQLMVSMPTQPQATHIVNTRTHFALEIERYAGGVHDPLLADVENFVDVITKHARTIGLPEGSVTKGGSLNYLRLDICAGAADDELAGAPDGDSINYVRDGGKPGGGAQARGTAAAPKTIADNDCTFCDSFICKSNKFGGQAKCICRWDSKFKIDDSKHSRGNARHVRVARKWHEQNKTVRTLKGVRFRFADQAEGAKKTHGAVADGPKTKQQYTSILMGDCFPGQDDFEQWMASQNVDDELFLALGLDSTLTVEAYVDGEQGDVDPEFDDGGDDGDGGLDSASDASGEADAIALADAVVGDALHPIVTPERKEASPPLLPITTPATAPAVRPTTRRDLSELSPVPFAVEVDVALGPRRC